MSLPADLPGQVAHVFMSSPQRDVLLNMAKAIESNQKKLDAMWSVDVTTARLPKAFEPYPIQEGDDVSTDSES